MLFVTGSVRCRWHWTLGRVGPTLNPKRYAIKIARVWFSFQVLEKCMLGSFKVSDADGIGHLAGKAKP